jgi:hypothetical protein
MNNLCQKEFGSEARMANTKEFILSPKADSIFTGAGRGKAWINAYIVGVGSDGRAIDFSVLSGTVDDLVCGGGWRFSKESHTGLAIFGPASLSLGMCHAEFFVACSAPAQ